MSEVVLKYQCKSCGAPLRFSEEKQLLACDSCGSEYKKEAFINQNENTMQSTKINWNIEGYVKNKEVKENQTGFSCTSCGAEILSDENLVATECMYCQNPVVMSDNISGMLTPDIIIPFKIDKEKAEEMLRDFYKGKKLLPDAFTKNNRISKISGMYVPFWLFSGTGVGGVTFNTTKVRKWSDNNFNYTKTEYFEVYRSGQLSFFGIPVDAQSKLEDDYMDGIEPYDYKDFENFNPTYMAGYFANKFDVSAQESSIRAKDRVVKSAEKALRETVKGYTTVNIKNSFVQMQGDDIQYALLPVWMLNTKYEGKMYQFAINGQTGRVSGELPIDKKKLLMYRIGVFLGSMIPITGAIFWLIS